MRKWIASDNGLKVIALVLALFVWIFVKAVTSDSRTVDGVPLEVKTPAGMSVLSLSPRTVSVVVRGTTEDLRQASRYELFAVVDLQHVDRIGRHQIVLTARDIRHPRRVQVMTVDPTNVVVRLEKAAD